MVAATLYTVYQLSASMHSRGWLTFSQDKSLYSYPRVGPSYIGTPPRVAVFLTGPLSSYNDSYQSISRYNDVPYPIHMNVMLQAQICMSESGVNFD